MDACILCFRTKQTRNIPYSLTFTSRRNTQVRHYCCGVKPNFYLIQLRRKTEGGEKAREYGIWIRVKRCKVQAHRNLFRVNRVEEALTDFVSCESCLGNQNVIKTIGGKRACHVLPTMKKIIATSKTIGPLGFNEASPTYSMNKHIF